MTKKNPAHAVVQAIQDSGLSIYADLRGLPELYLDSQKLEACLRKKLAGLNLKYKLRTRSKIVKSAICEALGYPTPKSFKRTRPRFVGQNFDTYVQKANNLQIWNEELDASRRYVIIRVNAADVVTHVRVVDGETLAKLDTTGTLTQKYQARAHRPPAASCLVSADDTSIMKAFIASARPNEMRTPGHPSWPDPVDFCPIQALYDRLVPLVGRAIPDPGRVQERNRGAGLHRAICRQVGIVYDDCGQFPDVMEQALEVKLQTSPTIDLGLVTPNSTKPLASIPQVRHCDVRYAVFYGASVNGMVRLDHLVLSTGHDFFTYFEQFGGKVLNKKLQIPLRSDFFAKAECPPN